MARIRSVKPEFHSDERLARDLNRDQRLFYIGMWNEADDEGRLRANGRKLLGAIFPYEDDLDETFVEAVLIRLAETGRAILYAIGGERICQLTKFQKHQKVNKPSPSKLAPPPKKVASVLGWLSRNPTGGGTEDSRGEVEVEVEVEQGEGGGRGSGVAREEGASLDFTPNDEHRARATELGLDVDAELRKFDLHRTANGRDYHDLDAGFGLWLERAPEFSRSDHDPEPTDPGRPWISRAPFDDHEPPPTPEERAAGLKLVQQAVGEGGPNSKPHRVPASSALPSVIDDPDVIAAREAEVQRQRAALRGTVGS